MNARSITRRRLVAGLGCMALLAAAGLPSPALAAERPEEILQSIYASYNGGGQTYEPPYTAELAAVLADFEKHPGFDFFIDGQDFDKVSAEVALASESDASALVRASVTNFGKVRALEVDFVKDAGDWKIANVRYPGAESFDLRGSVGLPPL